MEAILIRADIWIITLESGSKTYANKIQIALLVTDAARVYANMLEQPVPLPKK
jgi:hypothetical protein